MDIVTDVGVVDKAIRILRAIGERPLTLNGLRAATGLPRATAHRLGVALETHGMLRRDDDGRFELGPELAALGRISSDRFPMAASALPILELLRDSSGESVQLFVREGTQRRCVVSLQSPHALRWIVPEGVLFPLELGSAGRVLAGAAQQLGWVQSVEEREAGVASVSAPVLGEGGAVIAAVCVSGPIDRMTREPGELFGERVVETAAAIAASL